MHLIFMTENIINPFKQTKKVDWTKKNVQRLQKANEEVKEIKQISSEKIKRMPKSFKIYPGNISREFDKRINKMQVKFDDLEYEKDYVDSGKYIMFLMSFAEKYELFELYSPVDKDGNFTLDKQKILNHFGKILK